MFRRPGASSLPAPAGTARRPGLIRGRGVGTCCLLALLVFALAQPSPAEEPEEYQVKAAFLYNFAKFVTWPADAFESGQDPIRIGIIGRDPFGPVLDRMVAEKKLDGRGFKVLRFATGQRAEGCHILFVGAPARTSVRQLLDRLGDHGILTVGESEDFLDEGGGVRLYVQDRQVRFEINQSAAERSGLRVSSKLLSLARTPDRSAAATEARSGGGGAQ